MTPAQPVRSQEAALTSEGSGVAVTPHYLASAAAAEIMRRGGNAVDAAIAADAVLGVVAPETCGIGGDLFALVHTPEEAVPEALNASGKAGSGAVAGDVRAAGHVTIPIQSPWAVTVPGCVDGWVALADRYGKLPLATSLEPAIAHATEGFSVSWELSQSLGRLASVLAPQASGRHLFPNGDAPQPGVTIARPDLAETLKRIAAEGRTAFYAGPVGAMISDATGGVIRSDDLATNQADWITPISIEVMDLKGWTMPPNSQGYLTLAAAWLFEQLEPPRDPAHPLFTHAAIEAYRAVAWERDMHVADPAHLTIDPARLLDPHRLAPKLDRIAMDSRAAWPAPRPASGGTAYLCVRDPAGIGVSFIQSNYHGIGSAIGAGNGGFFLHDRGSGFSLIPDHPNELSPGKRPLHTLAPTLWTRDGSLAMLLGTRGGDFQPQTLLQMISYMLWADRSGEQAHHLPRWVTKEWRGGGPVVRHEPGIDPSAISHLQDLGHQMEQTEGAMGGWGPVSVIATPDGAAIGAADPRVATSAAASV